MKILPQSVTKLWNEWEVRVLVLISLFLQIVLILLGNRRKYIPSKWIRVILWLAYLAADWIAAVCIGILSNSQGDSEDDSLQQTNIIRAFWAPFLLLHLGGPDTITAYSMEDNELWLRHLLGLVVQFGGACYVFLRSWEGMPLNILAIPMFVAGLIKYGERTWALRSASSSQSQGFNVSFEPVAEPSTKVNCLDPDEEILQVGYAFQSFFHNTTWEKAFVAIEVELGFMYDVLYTKASDRVKMDRANKRWSNSMAQYNLLSLCLKEKPIKFSRINQIVLRNNQMPMQFISNYTLNRAFFSGTLPLISCIIPIIKTKIQAWVNSMLFEACRLAKSLQSLEITEKEKWEMMCDVWVEMLCYAASQCGWNQHAKQLRRGGELLTHVWLLMAHFGIREHFKISQGHASLIFMNKRRSVVEIFPPSVTKLWDEWEVRVLVLISLFLQIVLILLGNRRKYIPTNRIRVILWLAYLAADWIAAVCIGVLSNSQGDCEDDSSQQTNIIRAFWTPFLLLHLGGPDTITAYSMEDNELWLRHLLGLVVQFGGSFYIFLRAWKGMPLNILAIPMFVAGLIKYGERTWALRSASSSQSQGFNVSFKPVPEPSTKVNCLDRDAPILQMGSPTPLAIVLEMYAIIVLLSSDWTILSLSKHRITLKDRDEMDRANKRWSNSMAQYNLMSFCLKDKPIRWYLELLQGFSYVYEMLEKHHYKSSVTVADNLKALIFQHLSDKSKEQYNCHSDLGWSVEEDFDQSILLWHIATDLLYYTDHQNQNPSSVKNPDCRTISKMVSDYMLYLLVMCPFMLPDGIGQIRFQDSCAEAKQFLEDKKLVGEGGTEACQKLLAVNTESLQSLKIAEKEKWEMICDVWVEMLCYAASQCGWNQHAQQLRRGGELLTHVWLLMAHFGISEHFKISQGHGRSVVVVT
ncbi:unnamed protein product, partial [Vitis vinifera]